MKKQAAKKSAAKLPPDIDTAQTTAKKPRGAGGGRGDLSVAEILETASALVRGKTFVSLSMRELAEALNVQPPAIYYHISSRQALLDMLAESIMRSVPQPDPALPWKQRLRQLILALRDTYTEYPGFGHYMLCNPISLSVAQWFQMHIKILREGGFTDESAARAMTTLMCYVNPLNMLNESELPSAQTVDFNAWIKRIHAQPEEYRDLTAVLPLLPKLSFQSIYELGLEHVIDGLGTDLNP